MASHVAIPPQGSENLKNEIPKASQMCTSSLEERPQTQPAILSEYVEGETSIPQNLVSYSEGTEILSRSPKKEEKPEEVKSGDGGIPLMLEADIQFRSSENSESEIVSASQSSESSMVDNKAAITVAKPSSPPRPSSRPRLSSPLRPSPRRRPLSPLCQPPPCGLVDMEMDAARNSRYWSEIRTAGLTDRVQGHGNNKNLSLQYEAYRSIKGDIRCSPPPHWSAMGLHENDFFHQESPLSNTVLHIAARHGNDGRVEETAQKAPHLLAAKNSNGDTALHVAAKAGHISTLTKLFASLLHNLHLSYSENPKKALDEILVRNNQGNTFFHDALLSDQNGVMDFQVFDETLDKVPEDIVFKEFVKLVALFQTNEENKSVLCLAIDGGNKEFVKRALDKLISISPALDELIKKHQELAEVIPHGNDYVRIGKPPLLAAIWKRDQDMLDIILTRKPEWIHLRDIQGRTPLHYAASIGYLEGVQYLLEICASCTIERDQGGFFPLHLASYGGHVDVVHELLQYCEDPREVLDYSGRNILHLAIESGQFNVVRYLLQSAEQELGKMINDKDAEGNTPLHVATLRCYPKIVHALTWDKRVDITSVNRKNQTALDAWEEYPLDETSSLRQWLTWAALKSAGVRSADPPCFIKVPPKSTQRYQKRHMKIDYRDRVNTLILVSTLIITVTFAAGFTLPGGTNSSDPGKGTAIMLNYMWFKIFIFCITVSMYGAIGVTIILIWAQLGDITLALFALKIARPILGFTLATLSIAFLAGVHLVIRDLNWLATSTMVIGVTFILTLLLLYILLWLPSSSSVTVVRYVSKYPFLLLASLVEVNEPNGA